MTRHLVPLILSSFYGVPCRVLFTVVFFRVDGFPGLLSPVISSASLLSLLLLYSRCAMLLCPALPLRVPYRECSVGCLSLAMCVSVSLHLTQIVSASERDDTTCMATGVMHSCRPGSDNVFPSALLCGLFYLPSLRPSFVSFIRSSLEPCLVFTVYLVVYFYRSVFFR